MKTRTGNGLLIALSLVLSLMCSGMLLAQDKLLTPGASTSVADAKSVNCAAYSADGTRCIAGQYYHSDNAIESSAWNATATPIAFGSWAIGNDSYNGCLSCHHSDASAPQLGGGYLIGGHKNILRKVVPNETLLDTQGNPLQNLTGAYFVVGWTTAPDIYGNGVSYGSCARCHTTGYRFDGAGPEPTTVAGFYPNFTYTKLSDTQLPRIPGGGAAGTTSSWSLSGVQCERCHKADMQYDATVINPNIGTAAAPIYSGGRINHFTKVVPTSVNANATTGAIPGTDFYLGSLTSATTRPLPNPPSALTCVECHQNTATWTASAAGTVGQIHLTPLPGFESLAPQTVPAGMTTNKALTGQFSATFACSIATITTKNNPGTYYNDCITAGGTVTYVPGSMSHGIVATMLNSPHARVTGYVDTKNPGTADSTLTINGGITASGITVKGQYNTAFASAGTTANGSTPGGVTNGVAGSCAGCHDVHGDMLGYFNPEVNASNVDTTTSLATCASCHQDGSRYAIASPSHSQGNGTPYGITLTGTTQAMESCVVCHMAGAAGQGQYHFLRINSDPNYTTFPSAATYYTNYGSAVLAPLDTYASTWNGSLETYTDANNNTQTYPAVGLDVDIACGQCHTGGNGIANPYGIIPTGAPAFTRAQLANYAKGIHNTVITVALPPTFSLQGGTYQANSKTPLILTISEAVAGASICYTTDGTTPVYLDAGLASHAENVIPSCTNGTLATSGVVLPAFTATTTVKALAAGANSAGQPLTASAVVSATYTLQATAPVLVGGQFTFEQIVPLTGATQYCAVPAGQSCTPTLAAAPLTISVPTTVRAINAPAGELASAITTATFVITPFAPTMSPAGGSVAKGTVVTITGPVGSTIYYTTNGSTPTTSSTPGTAGSGTASVTVTASEYVRAIAAYKSGTQTAQSAVTTGSYTAQ
jgi:hypothetical protein